VRYNLAKPPGLVTASVPGEGTVAVFCRKLSKMRTLCNAT